MTYSNAFNAMKNNIRIVARGRFPSSSLQEIIIGPEGNGKYVFREQQMRDGKETWKFSLNKKSLAKIDEAIAKHKFFGLSSHDSLAMDGDQVAMVVTQGKKKHQVVLTNCRLPAFNKIIQAINQQLPKAYRVSYNDLIYKFH